jgi:hypothetical protein
MISSPVSLRLDDAAQQGKPFAAIGLAKKRANLDHADR